MTLREELQTEAYAGKPPGEMLAAVNANAVPTGQRQVVPLWKIKKLCVETGVWLAMKAAASQTDSIPLAQVAALAIEYINDSRFENLDLDLASTQQMLGALTQAAVISTSQAADIDAMADVKTSRAMQLLGRPAELSDISDAQRTEAV